MGAPEEGIDGYEDRACARTASETDVEKAATKASADKERDVGGRGGAMAMRSTQIGETEYE